MRKTFTFLKRNILELIREPISILFILIFPIILFVVMKIIINSIDSTEPLPQFEIAHLTMAMIVFSFSFIPIFIGNSIALDRESYLLTRLKTTPMTSSNFILGYVLTYLPIAIVQEIAMLIVGICFGLKVTGYTILALVFLFPFCLIFIGFGVIFGATVPSKGVGGMASMIPTLASLMGGMFFPLDIMDGGFKTVCYVLPFANAINVGVKVNNANFALSTEFFKDFDILTSSVIALVYIIIVFSISMIIFNYKLHHDNI